MNAEEIENLVDTCSDAVYGFCKRLAGSADEADELYQQTFLKAIENAEKIDSANNPKAFLISVAISIRKNNMRKLAWRFRIAPTVHISEAETLNDITDTELCAIDNEEKQTVFKIVNSLNEKYKLPLLLHYNANFSIEEIAKACKCPKGTVKSRLHHARQLVKHELEVRGYDR